VGLTSHRIPEFVIIRTVTFATLAGVRMVFIVNDDSYTFLKLALNDLLLAVRFRFSFIVPHMHFSCRRPTTLDDFNDDLLLYCLYLSFG